MIRIPEENSDFEYKLFKLIASGEAILMVGAGSSKIVGYPLWSELILRLEKGVREIVEEDSIDFNFRDDGSEDDLNYSSRLKKALGERKYGALLHKIFDKKECDVCHVKLLELPFRGIITTNYDPTLEVALFKVNETPSYPIILDEGTTNREIFKFFQSLNFGFNGVKSVFYLHGHYTRMPSIVLCMEDYINKYGPNNSESMIWTIHKRVLWALMATRRIIYIGFSLTDPFFQMMHEIVSDDFGTFDSETHFMITRFSTNNDKEANKQLNFAKRVKRNYGIQTVFYEDDKDFDGLRMYLHELNNQVVKKGTKKESNIMKIKSIHGNIIMGDEELTSILEKKARGRNKQMRYDEN